MSTIINWRDTQPVISHESAIVWSCLQPKSTEGGHMDTRARVEVLESLGGLTVHGIQGRKASDHHKHANREQLYYIISGTGDLMCGDTRCSVAEGDAIYLPSGLYHQIFNHSDAWLMHHVINMPVPSDGGHFLKRNWREVAPAGDGVGAVRWHLLGREGEAHVGCLRGLAYIDREMVQPGGRSAPQHSQDLELVYYLLAGQGQMAMNGHEVRVVEGDAIHLPKGTAFHLANPGQDWLTYLIIAAP